MLRRNSILLLTVSCNPSSERLVSFSLRPRNCSSTTAEVEEEEEESRNPPTLRKCVALLRLCRSPPHARQIHAHAIRTGIPVSHGHFAKHLIFTLISFPSQSTTVLTYAHAIFSQLQSPNIFTINTMIRGYAESSNPFPALGLHKRMIDLEIAADTHTYPFLLKTCAKLNELKHGELLHARALRDGLESLLFVQNALVHFYGACGLFETAHKLFDGMPEKNLVAWNSVINGFAINGRPNEALTLVREMLAEGTIEPDEYTIVSLLCACAELGTLALGRRVHVYLLKKGLGNPHLGNALVDLYAKGGSIVEAHKVFSEMGFGRNTVSWTSLIVGLAMNGFGREALDLFASMEKERLMPSEITLVGVLYACSHCGLVDEANRYFDRMKVQYNIAPKIEHYGCMVDLLGRAGLVEQAYNFILTMPMEPNAVVWRTLLGACSIHKQVELGEAAWANLMQLDPGHSGDYVLLSNLYASVGQWGEVHRLRRKMLKGGVRKMPGHSLVELGNRVHEFIMGDRSHPQSNEIYAKLEEIAKKLRLEGYVPRTMNVLADIEEEEKETALNYHSERLAIAFALLSTSPGTPIRIVKNLRVCVDCHLATKMISKAYSREIIVRDRSRFHYFKDGSCSCSDYW